MSAARNRIPFALSSGLSLSKAACRRVLGA